MALTNPYEAHYIQGGYNTNPTKENPLTMFCMDDRPPEDSTIPPADIQTAGSLYGFGYDLALLDTVKYRSTSYVPRVAIDAYRELKPRLVARLHGGGCAGEGNAPATLEQVASADPAELYASTQALRLNLEDSEVELAISVYKQYAALQPPRVPSAETAAELLEAHPDTHLQRAPLVGSHVAGVILSDLSDGDIFNTRAAWEAGNPAYNISFGKMGRLASLLRGEVISDSEESMLLAISSLRHLAAAKAKLRHPEPGKSLEIIVHE